MRWINHQVIPYKYLNLSSERDKEWDGGFKRLKTEELNAKKFYVQ
jgi:hypothetical protein